MELEKTLAGNSTWEAEGRPGSEVQSLLTRGAGIGRFTLLSKLLPPLLDVDVSTGPASPPQVGPQEVTTDG